MNFIENPKVEEIIASYPSSPQKRLRELKGLILETASEVGVQKLEECLKWGEPSYKTSRGSTIRMDWKEGNPDQFALYFICSTELVGAFKFAHGDTFKYEGNRAILFELDESLPIKELKHCISLALTYHRIKHLPMLGV